MPQISVSIDTSNGAYIRIPTQISKEIQFSHKQKVTVEKIGKMIIIMPNNDNNNISLLLLKQSLGPALRTAIQKIGEGTQEALGLQEENQHSTPTIITEKLNRPTIKSTPQILT